MNLLRSAVLGALCFPTCGCDEFNAKKSVDPLNPEMLEAVLRYQFANNASSQQRAATVYCISIRKSPKVSELIKRLADVSPPVRPNSECKTDTFGEVFHLRSGKRALQFRIDDSTCLSADHCNVEGGYQEGGLSGSGNSYDVRLIGGKWVVKSDQMNWIS